MTDGYWSVSAQYLVPSGQMAGFIRCHICCNEEDLEAEVLTRIEKNPRRKFAGRLRLYGKSFTPYTEKELARCV